MDFWLAKSVIFYHRLKPFALDLSAMPASQAFAVRVFSVIGDFTRGCRNKARITLAESYFLKINRTKLNCCIDGPCTSYCNNMHILILCLQVSLI